MKKLIWIVAAMLVMGLSAALADSSTTDTQVDIEAQGQQGGTITDYLKANMFSPMPTGACYDHDMTSGQFTCLTTLLEKTGLDKTLAEKGPHTLFAPTDEAFKTLASTMTSDDFTNLLNNNEKLTKILSYHVLPEQKTLSDLFTSVKDNAVSAATVEKSNLTVNFAGADEDKTNTTISFANSDAKVLDGQMMVDNGVIIPIDHVLMPPAAM
jgi:uncharacterized surface protein with fasciclin (FAS1) repeats